MTEIYHGGCHCGAIRYEVSGPPHETAYCHCRMCQRTTGAPVLASASVRPENFRITKGAVKIYNSSDWGHRGFCGDCGAQIYYRDNDVGAEVDLNTACLDGPNAFPPQMHIWTDSQLSWLNIADDLPRYGDAGVYARDRFSSD